MDLESSLLAEHTKANAMAISKYIGHDPDRFAELWQLIKTGEPPVPQRASWVLDTCLEAHPVLLEPYVAEAVSLLSKPNHNAVHRNLTKVLSRILIPEDLQGNLYDLCINWLINPQIAVAVKVHSMTIAANIAAGIPELEEELSFVIKDQMEFNSSGFKARGRHILKKLNEN